MIADEDDVYREEKGTVSDEILSNSQSRSILEDEENEEENIAPIVYLIIDIPQQYKSISYQRGLEEIMSSLSIDEVELKDAEGNIKVIL